MGYAGEIYSQSVRYLIAGDSISGFIHWSIALYSRATPFFNSLGLSHRCPTPQFPVARPLNSYVHPTSCLLTPAASVTRFPEYINLSAIFVRLGHGCCSINSVTNPTYASNRRWPFLESLSAAHSPLCHHIVKPILTATKVNTLGNLVTTINLYS